MALSIFVCMMSVIRFTYYSSCCFVTPVDTPVHANTPCIAFESPDLSTLSIDLRPTLYSRWRMQTTSWRTKYIALSRDSLCVCKHVMQLSNSTLTLELLLEALPARSQCICHIQGSGS